MAAAMRGDAKLALYVRQLASLSQRSDAAMADDITQQLRREHPDWVKECHNCSCRRCRARGVWYMPTHMSPGTERPRSPPKPRDARPWSPVFPHRDEQF